MTAPAGWYDDPSMVNTRRYWDGVKWTEHRQEVAGPPAEVARSAQTAGDPAPPSGWINLAYVLAFFVPPLGLLLALFRMSAEPHWAKRAAGLALICMALGVGLYVATH